MKKRIFNVVHEEQNAIAQNFRTTQRVTLRPQVCDHIELLFKSQKDLCDSLHTTAKTWRDIKSVEGVREGTAKSVLIEFISILRDAAEEKTTLEDKIYARVVPALDKIYAPYLTNLNFDELLERKSTRGPRHD